MHVGVVGLGGLGHLAVKFGKAFGMKMSVISTSPSKKIEAIEQLIHLLLVMIWSKWRVLWVHWMASLPQSLQLSLYCHYSNLLKLNGKLILLTPPDCTSQLRYRLCPYFLVEEQYQQAWQGE
ncbi:hypothetical protein Pint_11238 [Pistacia integerrima]|uniref:Uncharacterized protein n=1 Tax=Pistacia integerrima TaxID=434235 RepID=A0ACC0XHH9_9ROSI|nr:hypothetical protein Pint_11238 [Pistacia integerrima]